MATKRTGRPQGRPPKDSPHGRRGAFLREAQRNLDTVSIPANLNTRTLKADFRRFQSGLEAIADTPPRDPDTLVAECSRLLGILRAAPPLHFFVCTHFPHDPAFPQLQALRLTDPRAIRTMARGFVADVRDPQLRAVGIDAVRDHWHREIERFVDSFKEMRQFKGEAFELTEILEALSISRRTFQYWRAKKLHKIDSAVRPARRRADSYRWQVSPLGFWRLCQTTGRTAGFRRLFPAQ